MKTLMVKDIPLIEEVSDSAARKIVGGRWSERDETPPRALPPDPTGGIGYTGIMVEWIILI